MNERLQKFARQAGFGSDRNGEIYTSALEHLPITEDLEAFARLVEADVLNKIKTVGLINERGDVLTVGTSFRINE